jgi:hypothetical protein
LWSTARIQLRGLCELTHHRNLLRTAFQEWKQQHQCRKQELVASKHHLRHLFAGLRLLYQRRSIVHEAQLLSASNRYQMSLIRSSFRALRYARAVHQVQYRIAQNHEKVVAVRVIWRRWQRMTQLALEVRAFLEKQLVIHFLIFTAQTE